MKFRWIKKEGRTSNSITFRIARQSRLPVIHANVELAINVVALNYCRIRPIIRTIPSIENDLLINCAPGVRSN